MGRLSKKACKRVSLYEFMEKFDTDVNTKKDSHKTMLCWHKHLVKREKF